MSSLLRACLSSVLPAALIAVPLATFLAESLGWSWVPTFAGIGAVLSGYWVAMHSREDRREAGRKRLQDPCFGALERQGSGPWWGAVALESQPGLLPISIDAGKTGPSELQRQRFVELKSRFAELEAPLRAALNDLAEGADLPERSQLVSLEMLAEEADAIFMTAWSVLLAEGGSATFSVPLRLEERPEQTSAA